MPQMRRIHTGIERILGPGQQMSIAFVPGDLKNISTGTINDDSVDILLELLRPGETNAPPNRRDFGSTAVLQVNYQPQKQDEIIARQPWMTRVTNRSTMPTRVVLDVDYPSDEALTAKVVPRSKLNGLAKTAMAEVNPHVTFEGKRLQISLDKSLSENHERALERNLAGIPVDIFDLDSDSVELAFLAKNGDFINGAIELKVTCKRDVKIVAPLGVRFSLKKPTFIVRVGVNVYGGSVHLQPVQLEFPKVEGDNWRGSIVGRAVDVRAKATKALVEEIEGAIVKLEDSGKLIDITRRVEAAFEMTKLQDLSITQGGLELSYVQGGALLPKPRLATGNSGRSPNLEHLVIVMMENRSFDHMMHELIANRPDVEPSPAQYDEVFEGQVYSRDVTMLHALPHDPPHGGEAHKLCERGEFVHSFFTSHPNSPFGAEVLRYQPRAHVPFYEFLAENFCICDNWRSALPGHTWPNRLYSLSGSSEDTLDNPPMSRFKFYTLLSICDVLEAQQVPWAYFKQDCAFLELYRRWVTDHTRIQTREQFSAAIAAAQAGGKFPTVSWVEPNISDFGRSLGSDDHPPMSVFRGQAFLADVYAQLCKLPTKNWLLAITYDEGGGFYEHVGPEPAPDDGTHTKRRGFRVPAFFVSPWIKPRSVCKTPFDHASLVRTVLDQFCDDEPLFTRDNTRVRNATSFATVLDAGSPIAESAPRSMPAFTGTIPTLGIGQLGGLELAGDTEPPPRHPLYEAFLDAKAELLAQEPQPQPTGLDGLGLGFGDAGTTQPQPPPTPTQPPQEAARFEGLYIELATLPEQLARAGWTSRALFDDAIEATPPQPLPIDVAWDVVHELRARHAGVAIDPLWETVLRETAPREAAAADSLTVAGTGGATPNKTWHLTKLHAEDAWKLEPRPGGAHHGAGIAIGHLDTGYRKHADLDEAWQPQFGWDVFDDDTDPTDELAQGPLLFPGHGTATGGIIASRGLKEQISGTAPKARLIPFRISTSVVHVSMTRMVRGLERAVAAGVHVISISAGGLWSDALHRAVRKATDAGVIVVAAAGNYTRMVVWPARYDDAVISCGALEPDGSVWAHSNGGNGELVDVMAPGANVWILRPQQDGSTKVDLGSGTSFATACVSGAIATWLAFHGRERLLARYGRPNLARVAKLLIRKLTRTSDGKAGPLDMKQLLEAELPDPDISALLTPSLAPPIVPLDAFSLAGALGTAPTDAEGSYADELAFHAAVAELSHKDSTPAPTLGLELAGTPARKHEPITPMSARLATVRASR